MCQEPVYIPSDPSFWQLSFKRQKKQSITASPSTRKSHTLEMHLRPLTYTWSEPSIRTRGTAWEPQDPLSSMRARVSQHSVHCWHVTGPKVKVQSEEPTEGPLLWQLTSQFQWVRDPASMQEMERNWRRHMTLTFSMSSILTTYTPCVPPTCVPMHM